MWFTTTRHQAQSPRATHATDAHGETPTASVLTMRSAFHQQLGEIEASVAHLGALVESTLDEAIELLRAWNVPLLPKVPHQDEVSALRRAIQEQVLHVMARQAPVAGDLRSLLGAQVVIVELEHISDTAVAMIEHIVALKRALPTDCARSGDPLHTAVILDEPERTLARLLTLCRDTCAIACETLAILQGGRSRDGERIHRIVGWLEGIHVTALRDLEGFTGEERNAMGSWLEQGSDEYGSHPSSMRSQTSQAMRLHVCIALIRQDLRQIGACARNICLETLWQSSPSSP